MTQALRVRAKTTAPLAAANRRDSATPSHSVFARHPAQQLFLRGPLVVVLISINTYLTSVCGSSICGILPCGAGVRDATTQSISGRADRGGASHTGISGALIYVAVLASDASADGSFGCAGATKRPDRRTPGLPPRGSSLSGENAFSSRAWTGWRIFPVGVVPRLSPPQMRAEVTAMACELPATSGMPLSRWSSNELAREAIERGIVEQISGVTVWRWLSQDAIKPWQHRSWIFPRDPLFSERAGPILDLYAGMWQGERLHPGDYVVCADEKPSIQARKRIATTHAARRRPEGRA